MKPLTQLHLEIDVKKPEQPGNLPTPEGEEPKPIVMDERLNRMLRRAAHKAGTEFRRGNKGIFSN